MDRTCYHRSKIDALLRVEAYIVEKLAGYGSFVDENGAALGRSRAVTSHRDFGRGVSPAEVNASGDEDATNSNG
jgi:hypothetical protein